MKSSEREGWEGRPNLNCDFCVNCKIYGKLENSQKFAEPVEISRFFAICAKLVNSVTGLWQRAAEIKSQVLRPWKRRENSGKSQFTRKFVNLTKKHANFTMNARKSANLAVFTAMFSRVRKIANFPLRANLQPKLYRPFCARAWGGFSVVSNCFLGLFWCCYRLFPWLIEVAQVAGSK